MLPPTLLSKRAILAALIFAAVLLAVLVILRTGDLDSGSGSSAIAVSSAQALPVALLCEQPVYFLENRGQVAADFRFHAEAAGHTVLFASDRVVFRRSAVRENEPVSVQVTLRFAGAEPELNLSAHDPLPGKTHFYRGNDPESWQTDVPAFASVRYTELYPGIDLVYFSAGNIMKSEFHLAPGAHPDRIRLQYEGIQALEIDENGALVLTTALGEITEARPHIYQLVGGRQLPVTGAYRLLDDYTVAFELGRWDPALPLIIDPEFAYLSYLGGSQYDSITDIALTRGGDVIVVGITNSNDFPTVSPVQSEKAGGFLDYFVSRIDTATGTLVYSTYLGGKGQEGPVRVLVDEQDNVFLAGYTLSTDFPVVNAFQDSSGGFNDITLTRLDSSGGLVFSTYFGGNSMDEATAMAFDPAGNIWLTGRTISANFPVTANALQDTLAGDRDAFVAKFSPDGADLLYATYLGGTGTDRSNAILDDGSGRLFLAGDTRSEAFAGKSLQQNAAFVAKLRANGTALDLDTIVVVDGSESDLVSSLAVAGNHIFFAGGAGPGLPTTSGAVQPDYSGGGDGMVGALDMETMTLAYLSYSGTSANDFINDIIAIGPVAAGGGAGFSSGGDRMSGVQAVNGVSGLVYEIYLAENVSDVEETGLLKALRLLMGTMGELNGDPNTARSLFSLPRSRISRSSAYWDGMVGGGWQLWFVGGTYDPGLKVTAKAVQSRLTGSDAGWLGSIGIDVKLGGPLVEVEKQILDDDGRVEVGERVKYHIRVTNVGDAPADNVVVEDEVNRFFLELIPGSLTAPCRETALFLGYSIRCEYPVLSPGESKSISYDGIVTRATDSGDPFVNNVTATYGIDAGRQVVEDKASVEIDETASPWRIAVQAPSGLLKTGVQRFFDIYVDSVRVADDISEGKWMTIPVPLRRIAPRIDLVAGDDGDNRNPLATFEANLAVGDSTDLHFSDETLFIFSPVSADSFALIMKADDRREAADATGIELLLAHLALQGGTLDVRVVGSGLDTTITGMAFGEFSGYLAGSPGVYDVSVWPSGENGALARFRFDFSAYAGQIITIRVESDGTGGVPKSMTAVDTTGAPIPGADVTRVQRDHERPLRFAIQQNFPNPFNPSTTIRYTLAAPVPVELHIYDAVGRKVRTLIDRKQQPGSYAVKWDGRDESGRVVPSGVYVYRIKAGRFRKSAKMLLLR